MNKKEWEDFKHKPRTCISFEDVTTVIDECDRLRYQLSAVCNLYSYHEHDPARFPAADVVQGMNKIARDALGNDRK